MNAITLEAPSVSGAEHLSTSRPPAPERQRRARLRRRRLSLLLAVLLPGLAAAAYLWGFAADQFTSEFRFTVRRQAPIGLSSGADGNAAGVAAALGGGNPGLAMTHDGQVVVQYLQSREAMDDVAARLDLAAIYARPAEDIWARLEPGLAAEERLRHWRRFVVPRFDLTSGVVTVEVSAFTPADALTIARTALAAAERLVDGISARARADAVAYATESAERSAAAVATARARLAAWRNANAVLSPALAAGADTGLEARLREQLAEARTVLAMLRSQFVNPAAPQLRAAIDRVATLEDELRGVQARMAAPTDGRGGATLASLASGHGELEADERIALNRHERSLAALAAAEAQAAQQSVYLDAFVRPALAERASYPIRWRVLLQVAVAALAGWAILSLLWQAIRDHGD